MSKSSSLRAPAVMVFAGPSGGHLFPALAFLEEFRRDQPESRLQLVTSVRAKAMVENSFPPSLGVELVLLPEFPSPRGISVASILFLIKLAHAFVLSYRNLKRYRPDLCVGFGSFVSFPGIWLAARLGISTLIHEQNIVPGQATLWLLRSAKLVAVSFAESLKDYIGRREVTGLPIRAELRAGAPNRKASSGKFNLLVAGGSQGAVQLNRLVLEAISGLSPEEKRNFAVTHITGTQDLGYVSKGYREAGIGSKTYPFYGAMQELYAEADMAITRAGANTLFELALFGLPALVVPYPYAGAHQRENARYFESRQSVLASDQNQLTGAKLRDVIRLMMQDENYRASLSDNIRKLAAPDAAGRLVVLAKSMINRRPGGQSAAISAKIPLTPCVPKETGYE